VLYKISMLGRFKIHASFFKTLSPCVSHYAHPASYERWYMHSVEVSFRLVFLGRLTWRTPGELPSIVAGIELG